MIGTSKSLARISLLAAGAWCVGAIALAGGETAAPPQMAPVSLGHGVVPAPVAGGVYHEYYAYNSYVRRSYMPGFIPQTSSLFENPRSLPSALCKFADYYRFAGVNGWFFASPNGYQSSVPPGSIAHDYETGRLGITTSMQYGYPRGMRVIEPIIVPFASYAEPAGLLITSEGISVRPGMPEETPLVPQWAENGEQGEGERSRPPADSPWQPLAPPSSSRMPSLPDVMDK